MRYSQVPTVLEMTCGIGSLRPIGRWWLHSSPPSTFAWRNSSGIPAPFMEAQMAPASKPGFTSKRVNLLDYSVRFPQLCKFAAGHPVWSAHYLQRKDRCFRAASLAWSWISVCSCTFCPTFCCTRSWVAWAATRRSAFWNLSLFSTASTSRGTWMKKYWA